MTANTITDPEIFQAFAKKHFGFRFSDINLLITAFTHRSYYNEHKSSVSEHNERLEFLGDAVLELVSSDFLYNEFDEPEGLMTAWRSALVRTESISAAGTAMGLPELIRMGRGEKQGCPRAHSVIIADAFEAVIGAIYLDQGFETARRIIEEFILVKIDQILADGSWRDPKSYLQELTQNQLGLTPNYRTVKETGPEHDKLFTVQVLVGSDTKGIGEGHSKQEAQTAAARAALKFFDTPYTPKRRRP